MEETIDNVGAVPREVSADAGYLLGKGSRRALCSGRGPVRRAGADPPRPGCATRAPRSHTQPSVSQGPDATEVTDQAGVGSATLLRMQTVEPVFGQIKQGRGFRQFLLRGLEKVNGEWSLICTGHNLLKTVSALGSICTGKHGSMGQPNASGTFAEVVKHGAIRKLSGGRPGQPAKLVCRDPLSADPQAPLDNPRTGC